MTKVYWICFYRSISDPKAVAEYAKLAGPAMAAAGGRFLARGNVAKTYEAGCNERTILLEFDSMEQAISAYESDGYQAALKALGNGAVRDIRIMKSIS